MGIRSPIGQNLSLALGTSEVNLLELTSAYGVFANEGIRNEPVFILKVEDKNGTVLETQPPRPDRGAVARRPRGTMTSMLQSVIDHGTGVSGARARASRCPPPARPARPTTTPTRGSSATRRASCAACGSASTRSEASGQGMTGAVGGAADLDRRHDRRVPRPAGRELQPAAGEGETREICAETGLLATEACPTVTTEMFTPGHRADRVLQRPRRPAAPAGPPRGGQRLRGAGRARGRDEDGRAPPTHAPFNPAPSRQVPLPSGTPPPAPPRGKTPI